MFVLLFVYVLGARWAVRSAGSQVRRLPAARHLRAVGTFRATQTAIGIAEDLELGGDRSLSLDADGAAQPCCWAAPGGPGRNVLIIGLMIVWAIWWAFTPCGGAQRAGIGGRRGQLRVRAELDLRLRGGSLCAAPRRPSPRASWWSFPLVFASSVFVPVLTMRTRSKPSPRHLGLVTGRRRALVCLIGGTTELFGRDGRLDRPAFWPCSSRSAYGGTADELVAGGREARSRGSPRRAAVSRLTRAGSCRGRACTEAEACRPRGSTAASERCAEHWAV